MGPSHAEPIADDVRTLGDSMELDAERILSSDYFRMFVFKVVLFLYCCCRRELQVLNKSKCAGRQIAGQICNDIAWLTGVCLCTAVLCSAKVEPAAALYCGSISWQINVAFKAIAMAFACVHVTGFQPQSQRQLPICSIEQHQFCVRTMSIPGGSHSLLRVFDVRPSDVSVMSSRGRNGDVNNDDKEAQTVAGERSVAPL